MIFFQPFPTSRPSCGYGNSGKYGFSTSVRALTLHTARAARKILSTAPPSSVRVERVSEDAVSLPHLRLLQCGLCLPNCHDLLREEKYQGRHFPEQGRDTTKGIFVKERQRAVHTCRPEHWPSFSGDHYDHGSHYHQVCQRLPGRTTAQYQLRRERGTILNINLLEVDAIFLFQENTKWILWIIIIAESAVYILLNTFLIKKWVDNDYFNLYFN